MKGLNAKFDQIVNELSNLDVSTTSVEKIEVNTEIGLQSERVEYKIIIHKF